MSFYSETSEYHRKEYQAKLDFKQKEMEKLRKELLDKNVFIEQMKVNVQELKIVIERSNADLEKMKRIESENCELRARTADFMDQIRDLETLLKRETEKNESFRVDNFDEIIQIIEQKINSESNKLDEEYLENFKKEFEKLRQSYISKTEFDQKQMDSEVKYNKLRTLYEELFEDKHKLINGNRDLQCHIKQLESDKRKLEKDISHVIEENRELKINLKDIKQVCSQQTVDIQRLTNEVELNKESCKDCVNLRREIDKYGALLTTGHWSPGASNTSGSSSDSVSECEADRKETNNDYTKGQSYEAATSSQAEASKLEMKTTKTLKTIRRRQETFQETVSKAKKN